MWLVLAVVVVAVGVVLVVRHGSSHPAAQRGPVVLPSVARPTYAPAPVDRAPVDLDGDGTADPVSWEGGTPVAQGIRRDPTLVVTSSRYGRLTLAVVGRLVDTAVATRPQPIGGGPVVPVVDRPGSGETGTSFVRVDGGRLAYLRIGGAPFRAVSSGDAADGSTWTCVDGRIRQTVLAERTNEHATPGPWDVTTTDDAVAGLVVTAAPSRHAVVALIVESDGGVGGPTDAHCDLWH